jgi:hypothetical protein
MIFAFREVRFKFDQNYIKKTNIYEKIGIIKLIMKYYSLSKHS